MSKKRKKEHYSTSSPEHIAGASKRTVPKPKSNVKAAKQSITGLEKILTKMPYLWIVLLGGLVYFRIVGFDYVGLDDKPIITKNFAVIGDISNWKVAFEKDAFLRDEGSFYRPLQTLSFMFDAQISGEQPYAYHLGNLLLHLLIACSVYLLLKEMKFKPIVSLLASLLFEVLPVLTHAVAWIPARNDLLITLFCMLSLIFFIRYIRDSKLLDLILHLFFILLGFFSKETALAFPAICLLYSLLILKNKIFDKKHIILVLFWVMMVVFWFIMRYNAIGFKWGENDFGMMVLIKNIQIVPEIITKLVVPYHLSVLATFNNLMAVIGILIIGLAVFWSFKSQTARWEYLLFGAAWFLLMIIPGTLYRHSYADYFYDYLDHRAYLPIIGLLFVIVELVPKKVFNINNTKSLAAILFVLIVYGALAYNHSSNYTDRLAFRGKAAKDSPDKAGFRLAYGKALKEEGKIDEAEKEFLDGIVEMPQEQDFYFQLGEIYFKKGNYQKTIQFMEKGIAIDPTKPEGYNNLGGTYMNMGRREDAMRVWSKAFELDSTNFGAGNELIKLLSRTGNLDKAMQIANSLIRQGKNPTGMVDLYIALGYNEYRQGNLQKAIEYSEKALAIDKRSSTAYNNLGTYYGTSKDYKRAIEMWEKAFSLNNKFLDSPRNIFNVYLNVLKNPKSAAPWAKVLLNSGAKIPDTDLEKVRPYMN